MSDLIDRQAAIDAMMQLEKEDVEMYGCLILEGFDGKRAKEALEKLPSAQPEITRCKDCKWFRKESGWNCIEYTVCVISPTHHPIRREEDFCSRAERKEERRTDEQTD